MLYIVTGASSGIGFAVAESLAKQNHDVIAVARSTEKLATLKSRCGDRVHIVTADLSTDVGRSTLIENTNEHARVDGIVHAAGSLIAPVNYQNLDTDALINDLNIHVAVPIALNTALQDKLTSGRILYIDSFSATDLRVGWSGYSIVKAAAQMAARAAAAEATQSKVIRVFPGAVNTPLVETVLAAKQNSPAVDIFRALESDGALAEPKVVGEFIANILTTATDQQLAERKTWDFTSPF